MFSLLVYSGKGGVGKTTMTYCLYKAMKAQGVKVCVLDMDLNTPSFHHLASNDDLITASESLGLFIDSAQISNFLKVANKKIAEMKPDVLLIDSPPSITHIHYALMEKLSLSGVVLVTQPTVLSISDVEKTVPFFEQKGITVTGIIENMSNGKPQEYKYQKLASVVRVDDLDSDMVYDQNAETFKALATTLLDMDLAHASFENRKRQLFDESITMKSVMNIYGIQGDEDEGYYLGNKVKTKHSGGRSISQIKFINMATWGELRDVILDLREQGGQILGMDFGSFQLKDTLTEATPDKVSRLLKAFEEDDKALFMITRNLGLAVDTVMGEIGTCTLKIPDKHHGIPCVEYQTSSGAITLFAHEVMPADQLMVDACIQDGYTYIEDGSRMLPTLELAQHLTYMDNGGDISQKWQALKDDRFGSRASVAINADTSTTEEG